MIKQAFVVDGGNDSATFYIVTIKDKEKPGLFPGFFVFG